MMRTHQISNARTLTLLMLLSAGTIAGSCGGSSPGGNTGGSGGMGAGGSAGGDASAMGGNAGGAAGSAGAGAGGSAGSAGAGAGGTAGAPVIVGISCESAGVTKCNDGQDNDGDGKIDLADPECVHPCDNDEATFGTGISGDNIDACKQDCFFDGNSGQGDDGCNWDLSCDPASPGANAAKPCPYDSNAKNCPTQQSAKCVRNCAKLAPNGCDCFGCCAVQTGGATVNVMLGNGCTADKFGDPAVCSRCTQSTTCVNPCDKCEICLGRPAPTDPSCLPDGGAPGDGGGTGGTGGSTPVCPMGVTTCGAGGQVPATGCAVGFYCQTGCCVSYTID